MTGSAAALAALLAGCAVLAWPPRLGHRSRGGAPAVPAGASAVLLPVAAAGAVLVLVPGAWWAAPLPAAAVVVLRRRTAGRPDARRRRRDRRELAAVLDEIGVCLAAGLAAASAISAVVDAADPPGAASPGAAAGPSDGAIATLARVAALLQIGADATVAWQGAWDEESLRPVAAAAIRSDRGGAALAAAFAEQAAELRARCRREESAAAGRAGVLMTAPLAVCFLPAFLVLGLAPVVIGLLSSLRLW